MVVVTLFPFLCRGRVALELLFCHLFTALVTALMLSSGNHVHSFVFRPCVLDFSSVSGHVYRSVFYFRVRTRNVLVALFHSTSPCVRHGWVVVES